MANFDTALWCDLLGYLRQRHGPICRQWFFDELEPADLTGGLLQITIDSEIRQKYLQKQCVEQFTEAAQQVTGQLVAVKFVGASPKFPKTRPNSVIAHTQSTDPYQLAADQMVLSPDYSFETFVTGPNTKLAYAACAAVANQPGQTYNPLFIHGGVGRGKTHLLQAICQCICQRQPETRFLYVSCDAFVTQFIDCVRSGEMADFRHRYRYLDVLVIDDIHFLAKKDSTQEEFFHTFNELYQNRRQIVLSSDAPPAEIPDIERRLISRFQCGLVAHISRPAYETRMAILSAKAELRGIEVPKDVTAYIATKIDTNARELEGAITTIQGHAALQDREIDLKLAREALGDTLVAPRANQATLQIIIDVVKGFYNVRLSDLQSPRRHKSIIEPRQICMWLARKRTRFSLEEIGEYFGGRDHSTVLHSIGKVEKRSTLDTHFARQVEQLDDKVQHISSSVEPVVEFS